MKVLKKLIVWGSLCLILQFCGLYILEKTIFVETSEIKIEDLEPNGDQTENVNAVIPSGAENISISYNGKYLAYSESEKLFTEDTETGTKQQVITKDRGDILYHKWLSDRDRLIIIEKVIQNESQVIQLITYNPKDNSQITVKTICNYTENMQIHKISVSVLKVYIT